VLSAAFDADVWPIAVRFGVTVQLTSCALNYVLPLTWNFDLDDAILQPGYFVDVFVIAGWF
jgi:hypothetical protein